MTILIFVAVLLVLIVGHELGHFFAAKASRMKVLEFGVGFPPKIFGKKFSADGTEYTFNWLPFGGFVRILGEDPKDADHPDAFPQKHPLAQAFVLFAGPGANILLAFVFFTLALTIGTQALIVDTDDAASVTNARVLIGTVLDESPAAAAGLEPSDEVRALTTSGGTTVINSPEQIGLVVNSTSDESVLLTIIRDGEEQTVVIAPEAGLIEEDPERRALGVATGLVGHVSYPLHIAAVKGFERTVNSFVLVLVSLATLLGSAFTLTADVSQVAGPVGIAALTGEAAAFGFGALLSFAALLSVNLAIINLLPFPALDGGRLLFLGVETATRRKIPVQVAGAVNTVGFFILIALMVAVTVGDITRLVG